MIPILKPYGKPETLAGGTTRPWLLNGLVDEQPEPYVVKLFTAHDIGQVNYVAKEVMGSLLADEFDLPTPDIAFFDLSDLNPDLLFDDQATQWAQADPKWKFASRSLHPAEELSPNMGRRYLKDFEVVTIFSFDMLIWNLDRNDRKPNALLKDGSVWLIDHERAFPNGLNPAEQGYLPGFYKEHLFYDDARYFFKKDGTSLDTFAYYLTALNIRPLEAALNQLEDAGFLVEDEWRWIHYLQTLARQPKPFIDVIQNALS